MAPTVGLGRLPPSHLAPLAIHAVRRAAGIELSAALARELETVQVPKFATDEYSCRRVPGVDSNEVR